MAIHPEQRLSVTFSIYLSVVGSAYAISSLLTLLQSRSVPAGAWRYGDHPEDDKVAGPFLLMAVTRRAASCSPRPSTPRTELVVDQQSSRPDRRPDLGLITPISLAWSPDTANPRHLSAAVLEHPFCVGVLALHQRRRDQPRRHDDEALLRPDLPVVARTVSAR